MGYDSRQLMTEVEKEFRNTWESLWRRYRHEDKWDYYKRRAGLIRFVVQKTGAPKIAARGAFQGTATGGGWYITPRGRCPRFKIPPGRGLVVISRATGKATHAMAYEDGQIFCPLQGILGEITCNILYKGWRMAQIIPFDNRPIWANKKGYSSLQFWVGDVSRAR